MKKNKIIVWTLIWGLTTIILIKADKLEKNYKILCEIINSGVFQYVTIDLIINQLHKDNSKKKYRNEVLILIIFHILLFFIKPIRFVQGLLLSLLIYLCAFIYLLNSFLKFTLKKRIIYIKIFIYLSMLLLYIIIFFFIFSKNITPKYIRTPEYLVGPFFFEIIKLIINSIDSIDIKQKKRDRFEEIIYNIIQKILNRK